MPKAPYLTKTLSDVLGKRPLIERDRQPCLWCKEQMPPTKGLSHRWYCSRKCRHAFEKASKRGYTIDPMMPAVPDLKDTEQPTVCRVCKLSLYTPVTRRRGMCGPCLAMRVAKRALAREAAMLKRELEARDSYTIYERPIRKIKPVPFDV